MSHPDLYKTIEGTAEGDYREKGSKFLSYAFYAASEQDVKDFIEKLKKSHPTARHFCWWAVLGLENAEERANDDGEPSGTAGLPILNQIMSYELKNVAVVIVRYFGGTKLGKPGLINAYKLGTQLALDNAKLVRKYIRKTIEFKFEYPDSGAVMQAIDKMELGKIVEQEFLESCKVLVSLPKSEIDNALHLFDYTNQIQVEEID